MKIFPTLNKYVGVMLIAPQTNNSLQQQNTKEKRQL
jgi:hypothetical protein